jgi:hypothetical protein
MGGFGMDSVSDGLLAPSPSGVGGTANEMRLIAG